MVKRILVVDDDEALADNWEDILSDEGYELITANTCMDALTAAKECQPHVALLDLKLPDDNGINLMTKLKTDLPHCVCALMTAFADVDSAVAALEKGAFHYLQKPVRPIELINLLERIFETIQVRKDKHIAEDKLKESEERFRTIFESAQDAIFLKDNHLKYTLVNPAMEQLYKREAKNFLGQTDADLFGSRKAAESFAIEEKVLQGNVFEDEFKIQGKTAKTFHTVRVPLMEKNGKINGVCGFVRDITSIKQLENQLLQAQKMEAVGTLAGGISHDFNNLLQAIISYSQMLMNRESKDSPNYSKLRTIEQAGQRASELIAQLLAFSRKVEIHPRPVDLNYLIRQVEKLLKRTIPKMIEIKLDLVDPVLTVNADPGQVEQVLLNIGVNARDAMPEGGNLVFETRNVNREDAPHRAHLDSRAHQYVMLSVKDTGQGMTDDIIERIFEPFYTTKEAGKGTGLGLAMVYGIIQNHGGQIFCESQAGLGTTFRIYFPAIDLKTDEQEDKEEEIHIKKGSGETVLFIDDEAYLRDLAEEFLSMSDYKVITADNGESGLKLYNEKGSDISFIILDLIMPGMGGKSCLEEILKINPDAKVIICSGHSPENPETDEILQKAICFLKKPYDFKNLVSLIQENLSKE